MSLINLLIFRRTLCVGFALLKLVSRTVAAEGLPRIELQNAFPAQQFNRPMWMEESPDGSQRRFVIEQAGKIWILPQDRNSNEKGLFLDITDRKPLVQNEEGLLAFAFHPQFKSNGKFYIYYTQQAPKRNVLSEVQVSKTDPNKANLATERLLLQIEQPYWNHDGSTVLFGPDGYLYFSTGDGGAGRDPHNVGQSKHHLLGKILRIDVNSRTGRLPYGIPKDNPFVGRDKDGQLAADPFDTKPEGMRPEIWAYGLRNVWRMSFDRETGELWAADVGQDKWEEIDLIVKGGNYGWNVREGFHPFRELPGHEGRRETYLDPVIEYAHNPALAKESRFPEHSHGTSITGGYVYRGKKMPRLRGVYIYADFNLGTIWGLRYENGKVATSGTLAKANPSRQVCSFAEDSAGEVYLLTFDGKIYGLVEASE